MKGMLWRIVSRLLPNDPRDHWIENQINEILRQLFKILEDLPIFNLESETFFWLFFYPSISHYVKNLLQKFCGHFLSFFQIFIPFIEVIPKRKKISFNNVNNAWSFSVSFLGEILKKLSI